MGALAMLIAVSAFFFLPWLDRSPVKSIRYRGWIYKTFLALFALSFLGLMYLGLQPAQGIYVTLSRIFAVPYFAFFVLMPWYTRWDPVKPVPERVTFHVKFATCLLAHDACVALAALAPVNRRRPPARRRRRADAGRLGELACHNAVGDRRRCSAGARNFMNYCNGCHAIKYMRYQRMADDLKIPTARAGKGPGRAGQSAARLHHHQPAGGRCRQLVRQGAAGSVADHALQGRRLRLPVPEDLLRRSCQHHRHQQSGPSECGDAGGAVRSERRQPGGVQAGQRR